MAISPLGPAGLAAGSPDPLSGAVSGLSSLFSSKTEESNGAGRLEFLPGIQKPLEGGPVAPQFGEVLGGYLKEVDGTQHRADQMVEALAVGDPVDVHQVMLSLNEASNALHLTMQVRSKVLEAYQELMRTPM